MGTDRPVRLGNSRTHRTTTKGPLEGRTLRPHPLKEIMGPGMHSRPHPATSIGILMQGNGAELETCEKTETLPCDEDRKFTLTVLCPQPLGQGLALSSGSDEQKRLPGLHGVPAQGQGITCGSPTEGAIRLKEQGQARGQKPAWRRGDGALAPCRPRWRCGVQTRELGPALNPSIHTPGAGRRQMHSPARALPQH